MLLPAAPVPTVMWPYVMPMGGAPGCGLLCCSRPPLTVLALVGAGVGLPLSEEVLILGLGAQLPELSATRRLCVLVWALVGVVLSDVTTVALGALLRTNAGALGARAPRFAARLLKSVGKQLDFETRRDRRRLEEQLGRRLRATAGDAAENLRKLRRALEPPGAATVPPDPIPPPPPIEPAALRLTIARRLTCNTRTALASAGQAAPRLLTALTSRALRRRTTTSGRQADAPPARPRPWRASFAAAVDNRFGLGQRWPLALLTGVDGPIDTRAYALGSAVAALGGTLPATLGLGALLRSQPWLVWLIALAVAFAQACRFGPLWFAVGRAVADESRETARAVKATRRAARRAPPPAMSLGAAGDDDGGGPGGSLRLDSWTRLDDGRIRGRVGGRTLWIPPAATEEGCPARLRTRNGELYELGAPARRTEAEAAGAAVVRRGSLVADAWPALTVLAILTLSNAAGVVPGTCIGPAAAKVPAAAATARQVAQEADAEGRARIGVVSAALGASDDHTSLYGSSSIGRLRGGLSRLPPLSMAQLAAAVSDAATAVTPPDSWIAPEEAARAASRAARSLVSRAGEAQDGGTAQDDGAAPMMARQGEHSFAADVPYARRFEAVEPLAYAGDSRAQHTLGLLLYSGVGGAACDVEASAQWHAAAAAQGNIEALAVLGGCVRRGVGAAQDEEVGVALIEAAAAAGSPVGLSKLGALYEEGEGGYPEDLWQAARCFEQAAATGSALGLFNHGWALVHGKGVARDVPRGFEAWRAAAALAPDDGSEEAAYYLYEERGLLADGEWDRSQAVACLRLSASLGFDKAVRRWRARERRRKLGPDPYAIKGGKGKERFVRDEKARSWTAREERTERWLGGGDGA